MFKKVKLSMNSVKRDILKLLAQKEGSHFGDIFWSSKKTERYTKLQILLYLRL
jgi:hypothetical protein